MVPNANAPVATGAATDPAHKPPAVLDAALKHFRSATRNPEVYLQPQPKKATKHSELVKQLYDYAKSSAANRSSLVPDELVVEHMDEEQIWQQLELQNEFLWSQCLKTSGRLLAGQDEAFRLAYKVSGEEEEEEAEVDEEAAEEEEDEDEDESELGTDEDEDEDDDDEDADDDDDAEKPKIGRKPLRKSIVDDQFFKLGEMEEFLEAEDRREMQKHEKKSRRNAEEDDDGIDYFKESAGESEEGESDAEPEAYGYADFFSGEAPAGAKGKGAKGGRKTARDEADDDEEVDERAEFLRRLEQKNRSKAAEKREDLGLEDSDIGEDEADEQEDSAEDEDDASRSGKVKFDLSQNKYRSDSDRSDAEDEATESTPAATDDPASRSSHEHRQERLRLRIADMEAAAMGEKSWQLRGEINSDNRPQNSLLEEVLEFDSTVRPAPVITEETTLRLEDIIRQRIKDRAWNDVERKHKPANTPQEFRKQLVLDQEKSKQSLAQIYEKEYMKEVEKLAPASAEEAAAEEPKEHTEIRALMKDVFAKLDALGNFFYTPKVAQADVRIITNIAAINMEEVAPLAVSDAALLAPEEVRPRDKGDVLGKSERTQTDKNRERRQKKQKQREAGRRAEQKEAERAARGLVGTKAGGKEEKKKLLAKVSKARNVVQMKESTDGKSIKSSKQFFSQLQDEVSTAGGVGAKSGKGGKGKRKAVDASQANAKKFKM